MNSIIDDVAGSVISYSVAAGNAVGGAVERQLRAGSLMPAIGVPVNVKSEGGSAGLVRAGDAVEGIVAVAPVAIHAVICATETGIGGIGHHVARAGTAKAVNRTAAVRWQLAKLPLDRIKRSKTLRPTT